MSSKVHRGYYNRVRGSWSCVNPNSLQWQMSPTDLLKLVLCRKLWRTQFWEHSASWCITVFEWSTSPLSFLSHASNPKNGPYPKPLPKLQLQRLKIDWIIHENVNFCCAQKCEKTVCLAGPSKGTVVFPFYPLLYAFLHTQKGSC